MDRLSFLPVDAAPARAMFGQVVRRATFRTARVPVLGNSEKGTAWLRVARLVSSTRAVGMGVSSRDGLIPQEGTPGVGQTAEMEVISICAGCLASWRRRAHAIGSVAVHLVQSIRPGSLAVTISSAHSPVYSLLSTSRRGRVSLAAKKPGSLCRLYQVIGIGVVLVLLFALFRGTVNIGSCFTSEVC